MKVAVESILGHLPEGTPQRVSGGCIHECFRWGPYFIKSNSADHSAAFSSEAEGLRAIAATETIRTPEVIELGTSGNTAMLILEYLDLRPTGDEARLGESLANLHRHTTPEYGFAGDNFIGSTPQTNTPRSDWPGFFVDQRLAAMFDRLRKSGITFSGSQQLLHRLDTLLPPSPPASLLHGDLWGGNRAFLPDGSPVLFDPACYYGHSACDLAMTQLFGGFSEDFYEAYRSHSPNKTDAQELHDLYNLYHILNHALLFGGSYVAQAGQLIRQFC